jgi:MFS family permease
VTAVPQEAATLTTAADGRWRALSWLAVAELLAMSTWFSASAVITELRADWHLSSNQSSFLTIAVQLGFVAGALISAALSLADVIPPRRVMAACSIGAAAANAGLLAVHSAWPAIGFRFLTGMFLAGVYPPSLKAMSTWFRERRGMALGVMVGALTLGAALPHLLHAVVNLDWHSVIVATSAGTAVGGLIALAGADGPYPFPRASFSPRQAYAVLSNRKVRLASYGYFGHMWELYAMWTWIATYLASSLVRSGHSGTDSFSSLAAFAAIGIGAAGCVAGGVLADRHGRVWLTSLAMLSSGAAAAFAGAVWSASPLVVLVLALFWGFWVVADSAQFSAVVTEVSDQRYVGTAVTLQLAAGYTLTSLTIWLVPELVSRFGWHWAFLVLAPGPFLGTVAMQRLGRLLRRESAEPALATIQQG